VQSAYWGIADLRVTLAMDHPSPPAPPAAPGVWSDALYDRWPGASGWVGSVPLDASTVTTCGALGTMVGGFNKLGVNDYIEKQLTGLAGHSGVRIRAKFFKIDQWTGGKKGQMLVDGSLVWESSVYGGQPQISGGNCHPYGTSIYDGGDCCGVIGYQQGDLITDLDITVAHSAESLTLRFTTNLATGGWWGVNDIRVELVGSHPSPPVPPSPPGVWSELDHALWPGATGWTSNVAIAETTCGELGTLVGGYGVFGAGSYIEKKYTALPTHSGMRITGTMFKIDGWNNKAFQVFVDGMKSWESQNYGGQPGISQCCCGVISYQQGDLSFDFDVTVDHYGENATLRFTTSLDAAGDFWGLNDVHVGLVLSHPSPPAPPSPPGTWSVLASDYWPGATGWTSSLGAVSNAMVTTCGKLGTYLGGAAQFSVGDYIEKTFNSISAHTALRIRAKTIQVDSFNFNMQLLVDGGVAWEKGWGGGTHHGQVCGNLGYNKNEYTHNVDVTVAHYASTLTIRFTSDATSASNFWGVDAVTIDLVTSHPSPPAPPSPPGTWALVARDAWPGATGWASSATLDATAVTTCGTWTMIGGHGKFGVGDYIEKTFTSLPTHSSLRIRATLYKIDNWASAHFEVLVDGALAWQSASYTSHGTMVCGNMNYNQKDLPVDVDVTAAHVASSVTIRFTSTVSGNDDYWGLQEVSVHAVDTV